MAKDQTDLNYRKAAFFSETRRQTLIQVVLALLVVLAWPFEAHADAAGTLGHLICNIRTNYTPMTKIISVLAYTTGALFGMRGLMMIKGYAENSANNPVSRGVAHLAGAGALVSFPAAIGTLQSSLGLTTGGATPNGCVAGSVTSAASSGGLDVMMQNFVKNIANPMTTAVSAISIIVGLTFIFKGLMRASKVGLAQDAVPHRILSQLIVGAILVSIGSMLSTMLTSLFGSDSMIAYPGINWSTIVGDDSTATTNIDNTVKAILIFVQVLGAISFVRGWMLMKSSAESGGDKLPAALSHIIGGTMALNIGTMLKLFNATFGLDLVST